jgi:hypothetical protein
MQNSRSAKAAARHDSHDNASVALVEREGLQ